MKVLFSTNLPSPYRVDFFNQLGKMCELTVCYERHGASDRDSKWKGDCANNFNEVYLPLKPIGADLSQGNALVDFIKKNDFDILILTNYVSPSVMKAIFYCRTHKIPFLMEYDGGFNKKDSFPKSIIKKFLISSASGHLTTCEEHIKYLKSLGIKDEDIFKYPFTSLKDEDLVEDVVPYEEKANLREKLGIKEQKMVLSIGQFIHRKGFDVLMNAVKDIDKNIGVYIVGGEPTQEYIQLKQELGLTNVYFVPFKSKEELKDYYKAADLFVLPTREDIWGLVINEAMANSLPCITTDKCIAGLELVRDDENGFIIESGNVDMLREKMLYILNNQEISQKMSQSGLEIIKNYTISKMAQNHIQIFKQLVKE